MTLIDRLKQQNAAFYASLFAVVSVGTPHIVAVFIEFSQFNSLWGSVSHGVAYALALEVITASDHLTKPKFHVRSEVCIHLSNIAVITGSLIKLLRRIFWDGCLLLFGIYLFVRSISVSFVQP